jgi:hypothetical protein
VSWKRDAGGLQYKLQTPVPIWLHVDSDQAPARETRGSFETVLP